MTQKTADGLAPKTHPTSGIAVTSVTNCCTNRVETSRPNNGGSIYHFLDKPAMRTAG